VLELGELTDQKEEEVSLNLCTVIKPSDDTGKMEEIEERGGGGGGGGGEGGGGGRMMGRIMCTVTL
jgi:hypothetical protein